MPDPEQYIKKINYLNNNYPVYKQKHVMYSIIKKKKNSYLNIQNEYLIIKSNRKMQSDNNELHFYFQLLHSSILFINFFYFDDYAYRDKSAQSPSRKKASNSTKQASMLVGLLAILGVTKGSALNSCFPGRLTFIRNYLSTYYSLL